MFNYKFSYYLERPDYLWYDLTNPIKWAWQRVFRGWDDRAVWGVDAYLAELMPQLLRKLKEDKQGIPISFFVDPFEDITPEAEAAAQANWGAVLDEMIAGFEAAERHINANYRRDIPNGFIDTDEVLTARALSLLKEYFFDLWD